MEKTTFRSLTETGLRLVLAGKHRDQPNKLPPLATASGALFDEIKNAPWEKIRDELYKGRGGFVERPESFHQIRRRLDASVSNPTHTICE